MRSDTLEHDLKMHIIDLKMKISKLKAEKEQEKGTKEVVWRDACLLTTKCQQLEKMLADKDEQYVVLKNANDDLMDLKNQQENDMKNQYKSVVAENKQVVAENKKLVAENKQGAAENKQVVAKNKKVVAKNKHQKDMIGDLKATLKTAMDGNAKLKDRNAQLCSGIMSDMVTNDFKSMLSSFGYHANTSCEEFQSKVRKTMDKMGCRTKSFIL
jgi:hypothetical protein